MDKREPKKLQVLGKFGGVDVTGAKVGQTIVVTAVDDKGQPTEWTAVDPATKLSDLKNDLFYANAAEALTLTKADFVPQYALDDDGNPTDVIECYQYKGTPALDWFTSHDKIGFVIQFTDGDVPITINHHVPGITTQYDDTEFMHGDYFDPENALNPFVICDDCGVQIVNGVAFLPNGDPTPEDCFTIRALWVDDSGLGFDSITIYKVDAKKIPKELYDHEDVDRRIFDLEDAIGGAYDSANNAQTTANQAKTAANNAQTTADQAKTAASKNSAALLTLASRSCTMPTSAFWNGIAYGNGKFVAMAYNSSTAVYSEDGITWTQQVELITMNGKDVTNRIRKLLGSPQTTVT